MFRDFENDIKEIITIADKCPEKYQVKCFEILLNAFVQSKFNFISITAPPLNKDRISNIPEITFFSQYDISESEWQNVFNNEGGKWDIIVADLKESTKSRKQTKLALLLGVTGILETGDPFIPRDSLMKLCADYNAHDVANFAAYMKKARQLFNPKGNDGWSLTLPGKRRAAEIIKELAQ